MPLTTKGKKIMSALEKQYRDKEKAKEVFEGLKKKRKISGVETIDASTAKLKRDTGKGKK